MARVLLLCQIGLRWSVPDRICGHVVLLVWNAEPQRHMSMSVCGAFGAALLTACCIMVALTCPRVLPLSTSCVASCAMSAAVPSPPLEPGAHIWLGCMEPGTRPEPWRSAPLAMPVAWSSTHGHDCCGTSCTLSQLAWMHTQLSATRVMMPRSMQWSWRTAWSRVPYARRGIMTALL